MAGHARYTALLDACVLYPMAMADALMGLATAGLFAAKWTTRIEAEWIRSLEENRPDLQGRLDYRREQMREDINDPSTETRISLPAGAQLVVDSERMWHSVWHQGDEPRYCLITSVESGPELEKWIWENSPKTRVESAFLDQGLAVSGEVTAQERRAAHSASWRSRSWPCTPSVSMTKLSPTCRSPCR